MKTQDFHNYVVKSSLENVPEEYVDKMCTRQAQFLLVYTALAESNLMHLKQHSGPALGFYQIEPATHDDLWKNWLPRHPVLKTHLLKMVGALKVSQLHQKLILNLEYATMIARFIYYRVKPPIPDVDDLQGMARYWKLHYNTPSGSGTADYFLAATRDYAFPKKYIKA